MPLANRCILVVATLPERVSYLREAIASASSCTPFLDALYLSVNGDSSEEAERICSEFFPFSDLPTRIFCTQRRLNAMEHAIFFLNQISSSLTPTDILLLLGDDDLLASPESLSSYIRLVKENSDQMVGVGRFSTFNEAVEAAIQEPHSLEPGEITTPLTYLVRHHQIERLTNISGMLVPFSIYADALRFMHLLGSSGRRAEHILDSHRKVRSLHSPSVASALIRRHPMQEGIVLSYKSYFYDELVFMLWVWIHQPQTRPWRQCRKYGFTIRRFLHFLRGYINRTEAIQILVRIKHLFKPPIKEKENRNSPIP
jgi:hypothetical protein